MRPNDSFVAQPVRSLQTMLRVIANADKRLPQVVPDGIYGPSTRNAVATFQRLYGLPVTGTADQLTWEEITSEFLQSRIEIEKTAPIEVLLEPKQTITMGESNPYLYLLQGMLSYLSKTNPAIPAPGTDGILDRETSESIIAFQKVSALDETGILNRTTWLHLVNYFNLEVHAQNAINREF